MQETGPMSVSYDPAMKPLVDKSPPTGVQEFGGLMKKSCWESWEEPAFPGLGFLYAPRRGPNRSGVAEQGGGELAGPVYMASVSLQSHLIDWEFTAGICGPIVVSAKQVEACVSVA